MKIHEYQAKELFEEFGIPVLGGKVAETAEEAVKIAEGLKAPYVIKAQVHSGGRGKAGGVKVVKNLDNIMQQLFAKKDQAKEISRSAFAK